MRSEHVSNATSLERIPLILALQGRLLFQSAFLLLDNDLHVQRL